MDVPLSTSTSLATRDELFSHDEQLALAGFLAGYSGLTRDAYTLDLRQYVAWCAEHRGAVFGARRADIEGFARHLESLGRARATIARRLCTVSCFYRYAEEEGLIAVSPAAHVRRPRLDYESHATGLDRNEVGAMLVAAGVGNARDHALISLLALNGLRVSEAIGADIEDLGLEGGHRTLTIQRKGGKIVTIPLAPRTARAIDLAVGERVRDRFSLASTAGGSIAMRRVGSCGVSPAGPGSPSASGLTPCATRSSPPRWTRAFRSAMCRRPPATPTPAPPCAMTALGSRSTDTPPTSSPRSWPAPAADITARSGQQERSRANPLCVKGGFPWSVGRVEDRSRRCWSGGGSRVVLGPGVTSPKSRLWWGARPATLDSRVVPTLSSRARGRRPTASLGWAPRGCLPRCQVSARSCR